jgi:integrase/recombinase XerC
MRTKIDLGSLESKKEQALTRQEILDKAHDYVTYERRYSATNIRESMVAIRFLVDHYGITVPSDDDAKRVIDDARAKGLSNNTIAHRLFYLRLLAAALKQGEVTLKPPKKIKPIIGFLTLTECRALIDGCTNKRDKAIVTLGLVAGPRPSELTRIELQDVDLRGRTIRIKGTKTYTERVIVLNDECIQALKAWLTVRPQVESHNLFLNRYGQNLRVREVNRITKAVAARAKIEKRVFYYMLRHSCATHLVYTGSIIDAASQLGHKSLQTTYGYLHADADHLRIAVNRLKY